MKFHGQMTTLTSRDLTQCSRATWTDRSECGTDQGKPPADRDRVMKEPVPLSVRILLGGSIRAPRREEDPRAPEEALARSPSETEPTHYGGFCEIIRGAGEGAALVTVPTFPERMLKGPAAVISWRSEANNGCLRSLFEEAASLPDLFPLSRWREAG